MKAKFYSCDICGNIVAMVKDRSGKLVCCGKDMDLMVVNATDANEKTHIPVIKNAGGNFAVAVGQEAHPMVSEHFIEWVAVESEDGVAIYALQPGDRPEKIVPPVLAGILYAYCNLHGLWSRKV